MAANIGLIVGLGNPGERYQNTRHNIGFYFVDELARQHHAELRAESKFHAHIGKVAIRHHNVMLAKPQTFMNLSGDAVVALCRFYRLDIDQCLVVHDELALPAGSLRLKNGGGHGGHNGLRDIQQKLGSEYLRLRIGVGHPGEKHLVTDYLLDPVAKPELEIIHQAAREALAAIPKILDGELEQVMLQLHSRRPPI